ncbi:hypothetical protein F5X96DRAFT_694797 [Biscogniauxia mediterranea]|nr:hypothetical protein F5X96DRAFT_694797 [Biscogniauxia mediterranea]
MQGFNMGRYVPPDVEGTTSGNKLHGKHALGARASKLRTHGALTVRFEMPFGVWCGTCAAPTLIAQGVRFNAEKRRVGHYHSTPVFSFRLRHPDCGGTIEIRTDPANTAYVVVEGGKRRDMGQDDDDVSAVPDHTIRTDAEHASLRASAFARLEKTIADRAAVEGARDRIHALEEASARRWEDPYARNRRLRDAFRAGRKRREGEARGAEELAERMGLGFEILPGTEEDARRAALVDFGAREGPGEVVDSALVKPLRFGPAERRKPQEQGLLPGRDNPKQALPSSRRGGGDVDKLKTQTKTKSGDSNATSGGRSSQNKRLKSEIAAARTRENLVSVLVGNARAAQDPFLAFSSPPPPPPSSSSSSPASLLKPSSAAATTTSAASTVRIPGIKRKRKEEEEGGYIPVKTAAEEGQGQGQGQEREGGGVEEEEMEKEPGKEPGKTAAAAKEDTETTIPPKRIPAGIGAPPPPIPPLSSLARAAAAPSLLASSSTALLVEYDSD